MFRLDQNYYDRKCFFEREPQVPTQSQIRKKMGLPLANVYFKSMTPKLKQLAGLEPVMKGGGATWYMPPREILKGRHVLHSIKKEHLAELSYVGIDGYAIQLHEQHFKQMDEEKRQALDKRDVLWKDYIETSCHDQWKEDARIAAKRNTAMIQQAFDEFSGLYASSINKIEKLLFQAGEVEIKRIREEAFQKMQEHYETLLKKQATMLYDRYAAKLEQRKLVLKNNFVAKISKINKDTLIRIHDINVEKHVAVEKLRHLLECQNMACQVYVALKEREEADTEMERSRHIHQKKVKRLHENIKNIDFEIKLAVEKEKKCRQFERIWQKKVCYIVKKFQIFVSYCLNTLPEYADFFINIEKLMMLQLGEVMKNPSSPSIIESEPEKVKTPVPLPHPFYLCCEKSNKPQIDKNLCPVHCTSSAEHFPVVIINKRCIYGACDNFEQFTAKIKDFIDGQRGENADFEDYHDYAHYVPVRYTSMTHLQELKQQSSLMQILQKERPNLKAVSTECCICRLPHCFCSPLHAASKASTPESKRAPRDALPAKSIPSGNKITLRKEVLLHERGPKWESYLDFVLPKCECAKMAKHHLYENMPPYMRNMSPFEAPELPNYEPCDLDTLKTLVLRAQRKGKTPTPEKVPSHTRDVGTQYSDQEFEELCNCIADQESDKLLAGMLYSQAGKQHFAVGSTSMSDIQLNIEQFAWDRACSLRNLMEGAPLLEEIFKKPSCVWSQSF